MAYTCHPVVDTDERFTPPEVFAFRDAMWTKGTDTDPAWHPRSFSTARYTYTKRDDGLSQPWFGRVWLNPPWSDPTEWIERLIFHVRQICLPGCADPHEAMLCVRNDPSTAWWSTTWPDADAIAFLPERTRYWQLNDEGELELCGTPTFTSVVFYFGPHAQRFLDTAQAHGMYAVGLRDRSNRRRMDAMAKSKKPLPDDVLGEMVRDTIAQYARAHPERSLAEIANMLPTEDGAELLMQLRVKDLWPHAGDARPAAPNGSNGHARPAPVRTTNGKRLSPERQERVDQVVAWLDDKGLKEFRAADVMAVLSCSRQTALRTLAHVPNLKVEGKAKNAKYVVS